ncbi:DUF6879 family protein [Amycolatopsis vastitatis]|uniref:DUF6879 domain-containing protein n=1 Tax=Amycolatopsis vastitatis TaxID=1905142 RepID=A0A229SVY8_9PSEU|nr:DUF6879 family protein [Amycolatopsis vastitatis]OXM63116.1 hypothetical protein CF165_32685 [Amycolatopsis vastitatis]
MELLQGEAFDDLFHTFEQDAFHLEVEDSYHTSEETGPFQLFLSGKVDDFAWHQPWLELVREVSASGRSIRRVRVVTVPHVDYTRWGLTVAEHNIDAGEDIRWLPRQLLGSDKLTTDDFWLFDDTRVAFTVFEPSGQFAGGAVTIDPVIVGHCRAARDRAWHAAIPHREYVDNNESTTA